MQQQPSKRPVLLFFTRGRGRGHAIPDIAIAAELRRLEVPCDLRFVSYATGAETLREAGYPVLDLGLLDDAPFLEILARATRALLQVQPQVVVSHEEFAVLPVAKAVGVPTLFIVDFFPSAEIRRECLRYADGILFIEQRGLFAEPVEASGRVKYIGPVLRPLTLSLADRAAAREALGVSPEAKLISVIPGAWATERRAPIFDLVLPAFRSLSHPAKQLIWVAGSDHAAIAGLVAELNEVTVLHSHSPIERLMVASDLVITKANRGTSIDLARLGIPSISLSHGLNAVDEAVLPRLHTNLALNVRGIDAAFLAREIERIAAAPLADARLPTAGSYDVSSASAVAAEIGALFSNRQGA